MKLLKSLALLLVLAPTPTLANGNISSSEMSYLIKTCFETFYHAGGQPFQVDRKKFASMGFTTLRDDAGEFEAQEIVSEQIRSFQKIRSGPMFRARRNAKKPTRLLNKSCRISGGDSGYHAPFTSLSSIKVQSMLEAEAKRRGFKPYRNAKGKVVWIKGDVAVFLTLTFPVAQGQSADGKQPPSFVYVDGVHPKDLRGISR